MEHVQTIIDALGGGLSAVVILGLAYALKQERERSNLLADKIITMSGDIQKVMVDLAHKIDTALGGKR